MSGFVVLVQTGSTKEERASDFQCLLKQTARFKQLNGPIITAEGRFCTAAKLDSPSSLHLGMVRDEESGSWLLAAGVVVSLEESGTQSNFLGNLLAGYLEHGARILERYDGHFALVIYNSRENSLSIISDPMGLFAIYYARRGKQVFISSSALAVAHQAVAKPDRQTIECFLWTGRPYGEKTFWQDVKRVLPGTVIKITPDTVEEHEYWTPTPDENITRLPLKEAIDLADEKICRIFRMALSRAGRVWADLSGGFDSRLTALYLEKTGIPFTAYSVGPEGHPDIEIARLICKEMGWEYCHMPFPSGWTHEQISWFEPALGKGDGFLNVFSLAGTLRGGPDRSRASFISITGSGLDEWRYHLYGQNVLIASAIKRVNYDYILDSKIMGAIPVLTLRSGSNLEVRNVLKEYLAGLVSDFGGASPVTLTDIALVRSRHPIHVGAYLSAQSGIMRPLALFCFKDLVNFGLSIPSKWRIKYHSHFVRHLIEKENPRLANIRTEKGGPAIPIRLANLHRFIPLGSYLADRIMSKVSRKMLGRQMSLHAPHHYPSYPLPEWKIAWLKWAISERLLEPNQMHSGVLYHPGALKNIVDQALAGTVFGNDFIDWVVTVEMALRAAGAAID